MVNRIFAVDHLVPFSRRRISTPAVIVPVRCEQLTRSRFRRAGSHVAEVGDRSASTLRSTNAGKVLAAVGADVRASAGAAGRFARRAAPEFPDRFGVLAAFGRRADAMRPARARRMAW